MKKNLIIFLGVILGVFMSLGVFGQTLIISEVTDPGDTYQAKYVEIYNATSSSINLSGWSIRRYANGRTTPANATLSGTLGSGDSYTVAYSATFTSEYGFAPDLINSNITGNGDDVYELFNGTSVIDIYGEKGVDGTGEDWEYENSKAVRSNTICSGNATWTSSEWTITSSDVADMTPNVHTCDCPSSTPTITLSETNLTGFTYVVGSGPSTEQTFTVSGTNLTANISLAASSNYEISKTSGSSYTTPLTFTQSGGSVSATTVYVRLKSGKSTGTYNDEDITATSTSATNKSVECDGSVTALTPTITLSETNLTGFTYVVGSGPSAEQTFTVGGTNLTANISLAASTNYEISKTSESGYATPLTFTQSGGSVSATTVYVRLKSGLSAGTYNDEDITATSTSATNKTVECDGSVTAAGACATELIISEYIEGSSNEKYIEIYNGTGASFDLTGYELRLYANGSPSVSNTESLSGSLADGASLVFENASATIYGGSATSSAVCNFNGNDAIALFDGTSNIDIIGTIGSNATFAENTTLVRKESIVGPNSTYTASEWDSHSEDDEFLGSHTMTCGATITLTPATLTDFTYSEGSGPSAEQSFTVEGSNLSDDITITPSTNYEISLSDSPWSTETSIDLTPTTETVSITTIYVRLKSGLTDGEYNGEDITATSTDATSQTVTCSGFVCGPPTVEATSLSFPNTQTDQMDVSWTDGNGDNRIVVASTSAITGTPADNTTYSADANFGDGATLNAGEFVVYAGSGSTFTMTGLNSDTQYFIKVFEYNCDGGNEQYLTSSLLSGSETTPADLQPVVDLDVTCTTKTTATIEWTNPSSGDWDGVGITVRRGTNPPQVLSGFSNPSTLNVNTAFGNATSQYGDSPDYSYAIYKGTGTSVTVTGLTEGADYIFKAFSYYDDSYDNTNAVTTTSISALELNQVTSASATTENSQTSISWSNPSTCYDEILIVGHGGSSVSTAPSGDGSSYTANTTFGSGTDIGTNEYVVYKGSSTSQAVAGLTNGTTYYFTIFVRIGTEWSNGVEVITTPAEVTNFLPGDLAIIAVNTNHLTNGEEFTFVSFKDITVGTAIDFTDNGWQQENSDSWGTTEGTMRLTRISGSTLVAGTSVTVIMNSGNGDDEPDFDVNVAGTDELGTNWSISLLNNTEGTGFNLNSEDEIWMMQGGSWIENDITSSDPVNDDDEYTGYVLYGWTATGWGVGTSTKKSDLYPGCECFNTNVSGLSNQDRVKYTGLMTDATKLEWIMRFNDETNWTGYVDDASYDAATPDYRYNGVTIGILLGGFESGRWTADQNTDWFDCGNWQNLTIPDENTDVVISSSYATGDAVVNSSENALCHDISIESGIGLDFSSNTIEIHGDFLNQSGSLTTTDGTLLLAANEAVNLTTNGVSMSNVTVNGAGTLILLDDFILTGILTFTDGLIETGTHMLHVDNTNIAAISGYNTISYINGNLRRAITGTEAYDFPVGDASNYELATVDVISAASLTYLDAHFASVDLGDLNIAVLGLQIAGTPLVSLLDVGYWQIEPNTGASVNYDIEVNLAGASNAAADAAQHAVIKRDDAVSDWELQGSHDNSTQSISGGVVTAKVSGLSAFSQFAIARSSQWVLAVELVDFSVRCETAGLSVNWTTASEDNADYFMIEYSSDTRIWKTIQKLPAFGITHITQEYQMLLEDAPRKAYYRLAEVDMDGTVTHYAPAYVNCLSEDGQVVITVSPNPATDFARLAAEKTTANFYLVGIYDATGKLVNMLTWENPAEQTLKLDLNGFAPGYYQLKIYNEREFYNQKLLVK